MEMTKIKNTTPMVFTSHRRETPFANIGAFLLSFLYLQERTKYVTGAGGCAPGNSRRVAARDNSRPWQLASLVLIGPSAHVRGPVLGLSIRAHGSSLSLVLINRLAHVRGPVPGLSIRAHGSSLSLVLIKRLAHVRGG